MTMKKRSKRAILNALSDCRIDCRHTNIIHNIYQNATFQARLHELTNTMRTRRGFRQRNAVPPKLFTLSLENIFKEFDWNHKGMKIYGENLNHLRFADDITIIANSQEELLEMLDELHQKS